jgi:hypothetical protein
MPKRDGRTGKRTDKKDDFRPRKNPVFEWVQICPYLPVYLSFTGFSYSRHRFTYPEPKDAPFTPVFTRPVLGVLVY